MRIKVTVDIDLDTLDLNDMDTIEDIKDLLSRLGEVHDARSESKEEGSRTTEET